MSRKRYPLARRDGERRVHPRAEVTSIVYINLGSCTSLEVWHKKVARPSGIPKCTGYESKVSTIQLIICAFITFVYILAHPASRAC